MLQAALHVQHKDQEIFDLQNRVIPKSVVAVCSDTGDVRFGNGKNRWRELPNFPGGGDYADTPGEGYSGPLHIKHYPIDDIDAMDPDEVTEILAQIPGSNEMVALGNQMVFFGNGVEPLSDIYPVRASVETGPVE